MVFAWTLCQDELLQYDLGTSEPLAVCVTALTTGRVQTENCARLQIRAKPHN